MIQFFLTFNHLYGIAFIFFKILLLVLCIYVYILECTVVNVGASHSSKLKKVQLQESGYKCPATIDRYNWIGNTNIYDRSFDVTVEGYEVSIEEKNDNTWAFSLQFRCCRDKVPLYKEGIIFFINVIPTHT